MRNTTIPHDPAAPPGRIFRKKHVLALAFVCLTVFGAEALHVRRLRNEVLLQIDAIAASGMPTSIRSPFKTQFQEHENGVLRLLEIRERFMEGPNGITDRDWINVRRISSHELGGNRGVPTGKNKEACDSLRSYFELHGDDLHALRALSLEPLYWDEDIASGESLLKTTALPMFLRAHAIVSAVDGNGSIAAADIAASMRVMSFNPVKWGSLSQLVTRSKISSSLNLVEDLIQIQGLFSVQELNQILAAIPPPYQREAYTGIIEFEQACLIDDVRSVFAGNSPDFLNRSEWYENVRTSIWKMTREFPEDALWGLDACSDLHDHFSRQPVLDALLSLPGPPVTPIPAKGYLLSQPVSSNLDSVIFSIARSDIDFAIAILGIRLEIYQMEKGRYPDNLQALPVNIEELLGALPVEYQSNGDSFSISIPDMTFPENKSFEGLWSTTQPWHGGKR